MYRILKACRLADKIFQMEVEAPRIAAYCEPGQFLIVRQDEKAERIPLTICDYDRETGTIQIVFQVVGAATLRISRLQEGDAFQDIVGPLGNASAFVTEPLEEVRKRRYLFVAGGVGTAPVYPQVKWLADHGVSADVIIGGRTKELILMEDKMRLTAARLYVTTDDGSYGNRGVVTTMIQKLYDQGERYDRCVAIGPMVMMKFVCQLTKQLGLPTIVSINSIMVDGTGMCGACRLSVAGTTRFACVDGPEFDGFEVDWAQAMTRQQLYRTEEGRAYLAEQEKDAQHGGCGCHGGEAI